LAKFIWKDVGEFPFDRALMLNTEAIELERVTGRRIDEIVQDFNPKGGHGHGTLGLTCFLWLCMERAGHHMPFDQVRFDLGDVDITYDDESKTVETPDPPAEPPAVPDGGSARKRARSPKK
jgi:hypothetical protein